jgi:hypothetical protein
VAGPLPTQTRANYACAVRASTVDQALYLTLKTVEGHLARVYGKLEISSRGQLARGLGDERTRVPPSSEASDLQAIFSASPIDSHARRNETCKSMHR